MKIFFTKKVYKQLNTLPEPIRKLVVQKIKILIESRDSVNIKKLTNRPDYRLRIGDYRVIFNKDNKNKLIIVVSVAHRKDAYRR